MRKNGIELNQISTQKLVHLSNLRINQSHFFHGKRKNKQNIAYRASIKNLIFNIMRRVFKLWRKDMTQ
jgi:hypothetical protein